MDKQIFLVDDDFIFRTAATVLLKRELPKYETHHFENGLLVYEKLMELAEKPNDLPELLFLDINMPVMNGWELLEELKAGPTQIIEKVCIYILTSSIAPEDMNLSETYQFIKGYITKPFTKEDIKRLQVN